jgi:hypothetical protein
VRATWAPDLPSLHLLSPILFPYRRRFPNSVIPSLTIQGLLNLNLQRNPKTLVLRVRLQQKSFRGALLPLLLFLLIWRRYGARGCSCARITALNQYRGQPETTARSRYLVGLLPKLQILIGLELLYELAMMILTVPMVSALEDALCIRHYHGNIPPFKLYKHPSIRETWPRFEAGQHPSRHSPVRTMVLMIRFDTDVPGNHHCCAAPWSHS